MAGAYTVVQYAALLAIYMGFSEIYLLGCDMTGILNNVASLLKENEMPGYAFEMSELDKERLRMLNESIPIEAIFQGFAHVFEGYRYLNEYCQKNGIKLCNLTKGGILNTLLRERYEDVIGGGGKNQSK